MAIPIHSVIFIYSNDGATLLYSLAASGGDEIVVSETGLSSSSGPAYTYSGDKKFIGVSTSANATTPTYAIGDSFSTGSSDMTVYIVEEEETPSKPTEYTLRIDGVEVTDYENVIINGVKYPTKKYVPEWTEMHIGYAYGDETTTPRTIKITKETTDETRIYKNDELLLSTTTIGESTFEVTYTLIGDVFKFEGGEFDVTSSAEWSLLFGASTEYVFIGKNFTKIPKGLLSGYNGSRTDKRLYIPNHITSIAASALTSYQKSLIIPSSITSIGDKAFSSGNTSSSRKEIIFNHTTEDTITLPIAGSSTGMLYAKSAYSMTIYHYGNETILNYDYSKDNVTPTFVDLREAK